jgi:hypothetical protein
MRDFPRSTRAVVDNLQEALRAAYAGLANNIHDAGRAALDAHLLGAHDLTADPWRVFAAATAAAYATPAAPPAPTRLAVQGQGGPPQALPTNDAAPPAPSADGEQVPAAPGGATPTPPAGSGMGIPSPAAGDTVQVTPCAGGQGPATAGDKAPSPPAEPGAGLPALPAGAADPAAPSDRAPSLPSQRRQQARLSSLRSLAAAHHHPLATDRSPSRLGRSRRRQQRLHPARRRELNPWGTLRRLRRKRPAGSGSHGQ